MTDGSPCTFDDCGGTIDGGYCNICGRAPRKPGAPVRVPLVLPQAPAAPSAHPVPTVPITPPPAPGPTPGFAPPPTTAPPLAPPPGPPVLPIAAAPTALITPMPGRPASVVTAPPPGPATPPDGLAAEGESGTTRSVPTLRPTSLRTGPGEPRAVPRTDSVRGSSAAGSRSGATAHRGRTARLGLGLVDIAPIRPGDPARALMEVAEVPEDRRFCPHCDKPVGRSRNKRSGRTEGFCPYCRNHFSFTPRLASGDLVGGQYEVLGALAHGGMGWVYLARDRAVSDRWVVLKGLLDADSEEAAAAAAAERRFLAAIDHPAIVEIHNFVTHEGGGYIVMEYVGGKSLKTLLAERRETSGGRIDPLPVAEAVAYMVGVLPALTYLHDKGLLYCDLKPDNVILTGDSLKVIDVGSVRRADDDDAPVYGTVGFQAPEVTEDGPSEASDLYTVGRTLAVLTMDFRGYQTSYVDSLPPAEDQPVLAAHESLHRFLLKATAVDPTDRFRSAEAMGEQLLGILREEAAVGGAAHPAVSAVFGPDAMGAGLGEHESTAVADWRLLPRPKVIPEDPGADFLLGLAETDPAAAAATISSALMTRTVPASTETLLRLARAQLEVGLPEHAASTLDSLTDAGNWRLWWHRGLLALVTGKAAEAVDWLDPIYTEMPGEVAPKLALGVAHEVAGDLARSADLYDRATRTDPSYVSGAFGLARVRLALGDREGAVEALRRVPAASSAHPDAEVAALRALTARGDDSVGVPSPDQLVRASAILDHLDLAPRQRALLTLEVYEAGLAALTGLAATGGDVSGAAGDVLDQPLEERALRHGLEGAYRQLARHASTRRERTELVDHANRVRPRTWL